MSVQSWEAEGARAVPQAGDRPGRRAGRVRKGPRRQPPPERQDRFCSHVDETHSKERACVMTEAWLSTHLLSAGRGPRRAGGIVPACLLGPGRADGGVTQNQAAANLGGAVPRPAA